MDQGKYSLVALAVFWWVGVASQVSAQSASIVPYEIKGQNMPTMSVRDARDFGVSVFEGVSITIETKGNWSRFMAVTSAGQVYSDWYSTKGFAPWVALDINRLKFHVLAPRIKVNSKDYASIVSVAKELGATRTEILDRLGYVTVWLPSDISPVEVATALKARLGLDSVELQVEKPPEVPM